MGHAVAVTGPGHAELMEIEDAPAGPRDVAGPTVCSLVSPGTELATYSDTLGALDTIIDRADEAWHVPGYAAVFCVDELGADVEHLEPGQLVYCMGGHRSRQCHPADMVIPLPDGLAPEAAVFARMAGVGMSTLTTTTARPPDPVLVLGLGLIGNLTAQAFQTAGYEVVAFDPTASRVALAQELGVRDARTELEPPASPAFPPSSPGQPPAGSAFALVVHCSGDEETVVRGCRLVRPGGEVVLVATPWRRKSDASAHDLLHEVFFRYAHLRSGWEWEVPVHEEPWRTGSMLGNQALALRWLAEGKLSVGALGTQADPRAVQETYQALLRREGPPTRIFTWTG